MLYYVSFVAIVITGMLYAVKGRKLTMGAAITGMVIACMVFFSASYVGLGMMICFFLTGTLATSFKYNKKVQLGLYQGEKEVRTARQVGANAGLAGLAGVLMMVDKAHAALYLVMMASVFSSATADTLSSEMGNVYGSKYYDVLTFKTGLRGHNGVISAEGTLIGLGGSCLVASIYGASRGYDKNMLFIIVAGLAGNLFDSVLGATLERRGVLSNNAVNFLNTLFALLVGALPVKCF